MSEVSGQLALQNKYQESQGYIEKLCLESPTPQKERISLHKTCPTKEVKHVDHRFYNYSASTLIFSPISLFFFPSGSQIVIN